MKATLPLSCRDREDLAEYVAVIDRGVNTFAEVGLALASIRDRKLYRQEADTFEEFCLLHWAMTARHGRRMIDAYEVVANLQSGPIGPVPANEAQCRPLAALDPADQRAAWQEANADGRATAKKVAQIAEKYLKPQPTKDAIKAEEKRVLNERARRDEAAALEDCRRLARKLADRAAGLAGGELLDVRGWLGEMPRCLR